MVSGSPKSQANEDHLDAKKRENSASPSEQSIDYWTIHGKDIQEVLIMVSARAPSKI